MINIERTYFGYKATYSGIISLDEIRYELSKAKTALEKNIEKFSVLVDMRKMEILPVECQDIMYEGQILFKKKGMVRSVLIVDNRLTALQFKLLAQKAGIHSGERYINVSANPNWEKEALDWLLNSVEPSCDDELINQT